jgi:EmrB/QacA subfamily drug resistance transporter
VPAAVWRVAGVVVVGAFMTQLDAALVNIGLATIADDLGQTLQATQWIVSGYLLALVVGLPLCGWLVGRVGAGRLWSWALAGFTLASVLCAFAPNLGSLVAARAVQGLTGGLLLPAGQTIIAQVAGRERMGRVMSLVGAPLVLGPALGPTLGGFIISQASWPWLFWINLPIGLVGLWLGRRFIPRGGGGSSAPFDLPGFVLIGVGLPAVTYAVGTAGSGSIAAVAVPLVVGLAAVAAFVWRSLRTSAPLLATRLFAQRVFAASAATSFLAGAVQIGVLVVWALHFQLVRGYDLVTSGLALLVFALGSALLPLAGRATDRYGGGPVALAGAVLATVTLVPLTLLPPDTPVVVVEIGLFLLGVANAMSVVPTSTAAYVTLPPAKVPDAVTQINILLRLGGAVGAAAVVTVLGDRSQPADQLFAGFQRAGWCLVLFAALSVLSALVLAAAARRDPSPAGGPS